MDWYEAVEKRLNGLNELDEFCLKPYESSTIYKVKMKNYHDQKIEKREFAVGYLLLLLNSRLRLFLSKLKSKWTGPILVTKVFPHGSVESENKKGANFTFNRQRIKIYLGHAESVHEVVDAYHPDEV
nr:uncharacterized protein LOC101262435 [Solanum lycopersicum]